MIPLAAGAADSPLAFALGFVVIGSLVAGGLTMTIIRIVRSVKPREKQMARLAAQLDGRNQVCIRMMEIGLDKADIQWVAHSRGYGMIEHRFGKYYEFVRLPQQAPWQGRP
jgi:hypothetical protein